MQELIAGLGLLGPILIVVIIWLAACIRVVNEYERAVIFTLGKVGAAPKGPGLVFVLKPFQRAVVVSLRTVVLDVPSQDIITRDNVSLKVSAVVYFRVLNSQQAILGVENYYYATSQIAQTTLRSVLGEVSLDELLAERESSASACARSSTCPPSPGAWR